jgi:hypothetical protein
MRRSTLLALAATSFFASAGSRALHAQEAESKKSILFVVNGGVTVPTGDLSSFNTAGFHANASLIMKFAGFPLALRPEFSLTRLPQQAPDPNELADPFPTTADSTQTTQMLGLLGNLQLPLVLGFYVLAGVGALNLDNASVSQTSATVNVGAGWRFHIGRLGGFLEARYGSASYNSGTFGFSGAQTIPVSVGITF